MAQRISPGTLLLVLSLSLLAEPSAGQNNPPLMQNLTFSAIRLWTNSPKTVTEGRVELILSNGVIGVICAKYWNATETARNVNVTCAMLGYRNGGQKVNNTYGIGNKNFVIENATCPDNATSWYQCIQYFKKTCGPEDEELSVICNPDPNGSNYVQLADTVPIPGSGGLPPIATVVKNVTLYGGSAPNCVPNPKIRLLGGDAVNTSIGNGYVQVNVNGSWGFICPNTWNQAAATVVCQELCYESVFGFTPLPGIIAHSVPDPLDRAFALTNVNCLGNETSILQCPVGSVPASCPATSLLAGVQCRPDCCESGKPIVLPSMNCSNEVMYANFSKAIFPLITVSNIYMANSANTNCMNVTSNRVGDVLVTVSVTSGCGVDLQQNATHITYMVSFRVIWVSGVIVFNSYSNVRYDLVCSVPKTYIVGNRVQPYTLSPNLTIYQQYNFSLSMALYQDCNFTAVVGALNQVYLLEVGQWLNALITVDNYDTRTKLVLTDCEEYPVIPYTSYTPMFKIMNDKCPVDSTFTVYQLDNRRVGFRVRASMIAGYSMLYIRCSVNVCLLDSTSPECDRTCNSDPLTGRRKRSPSKLQSAVVNSKSVMLFDPKDTGVSSIAAMLNQQAQQEQASGAAVTSNANQGTSNNEQNQSSTKGDQKTTKPTENPSTNAAKQVNGQSEQQKSQDQKVTDQPGQRPNLDQKETDQTEQPQYQAVEQKQRRLVEQETESGVNSSSLKMPQLGVAEALEWKDPNTASFVQLSSVMCIATCVAWLVYMLAGAQMCG